MERISIEKGWEVYNQMTWDREFNSSQHEEMVKENYWRGKGYIYKDGKIIL